MTYTALAVIAVIASVCVDRVITRTRLTTSRTWWAAYAILLIFQLVTNAWLTGRGIVRYDGDAIVGTARITWLGDGRLFWAPVEDVGFGFALILLTCAVWDALAGRRRRRCATS